MKRSHLLSGTFLSLALLVSSPALAQDSNRYEQWNAQGGSTKDMVKALRELVGEAERARAADPRFLDDLKALADAFDKAVPPPSVDIIRDDFRDGDYTRGTVWTVTDGRWWVENAVGLRSLVAALAAGPVANEPAPSEPARPRAGDDLAEAILGNILDQVTRPRDSEPENSDPPPSSQNQRNGGDTSPADIQVEAAIPNAFTVRMEMTSRARHGALQIGPYQVSSRDGWGYWLTYKPGDPKALTLSRFSRGRPTVVATYNGTLDLEDGRLHVIDWTRSASGAMTVSLDGTKLIQVSDARLRDPFDGFAISNQGGDYAVRAITVARGQ